MSSNPKNSSGSNAYFQSFGNSSSNNNTRGTATTVLESSPSETKSQSTAKLKTKSKSSAISSVTQRLLSKSAVNTENYDPLHSSKNNKIPKNLWQANLFEKAQKFEAHNQEKDKEKDKKLKQRRNSFEKKIRFAFDKKSTLRKFDQSNKEEENNNFPIQSKKLKVLSPKFQSKFLQANNEVDTPETKGCFRFTNSNKMTEKEKASKIKTKLKDADSWKSGIQAKGSVTNSIKNPKIRRNNQSLRNIQSFWKENLGENNAKSISESKDEGAESPERGRGMTLGKDNNARVKRSRTIDPRGPLRQKMFGPQNGSNANDLPEPKSIQKYKTKNNLSKRDSTPNLFKQMMLAEKRRASITSIGEEPNNDDDRLLEENNLNYDKETLDFELLDTIHSGQTLMSTSLNSHSLIEIMTEQNDLGRRKSLASTGISKSKYAKVGVGDLTTTAEDNKPSAKDLMMANASNHFSFLQEMDGGEDFKSAMKNRTKSKKAEKIAKKIEAEKNRKMNNNNDNLPSIKITGPDDISLTTNNSESQENSRKSSTVSKMSQNQPIISNIEHKDQTDLKKSKKVKKVKVKTDNQKFAELLQNTKVDIITNADQNPPQYSKAVSKAAAKFMKIGDKKSMFENILKNEAEAAKSPKTLKKAPKLQDSRRHSTAPQAQDAQNLGNERKLSLQVPGVQSQDLAKKLQLIDSKKPKTPQLLSSPDKSPKFQQKKSINELYERIVKKQDAIKNDLLSKTTTPETDISPTKKDKSKSGNATVSKLRDQLFKLPDDQNLEELTNLEKTRLKKDRKMRSELKDLGDATKLKFKKGGNKQTATQEYKIQLQNSDDENFSESDNLYSPITPNPYLDFEISSQYSTPSGSTPNSPCTPLEIKDTEEFQMLQKEVDDQIEKCKELIRSDPNDEIFQQYLMSVEMKNVLMEKAKQQVPVTHKKSTQKTKKPQTTTTKMKKNKSNEVNLRGVEEKELVVLKKEEPAPIPPIIETKPTKIRAHSPIEKVKEIQINEKKIVEFKIEVPSPKIKPKIIKDTIKEPERSPSPVPKIIEPLEDEEEAESDKEVQLNLKTDVLDFDIFKEQKAQELNRKKNMENWEKLGGFFYTLARSKIICK